MSLRKRIKKILTKHSHLRNYLIWMIAPTHNPRPRRWIRFFSWLFISVTKGKQSILRFPLRLDIFPWHQFSIGKFSTIESFSVLNNGVGDIILQNHVRIGIGSVIVGPCIFEDHSGTGQHVFISGFNHNYEDTQQLINKQSLHIKPVKIGFDSHIGSNAIVLPGITIGKHCIIGAGSVVTKNVPDFSVVAGNPAKVIKYYEINTKHWIYNKQNSLH